MLAVIGIVLLVEVPVVIWLMVRRNWDALNEEALTATQQAELAADLGWLDRSGGP